MEEGDEITAGAALLRLGTAPPQSRCASA